MVSSVCANIFVIFALLHGMSCTTAFSIQTSSKVSSISTTQLAVATVPKKKGYDPKWKKKKTLAEELDAGGVKDLSQIGLKGNVAVVFKQANETKSTMAIEGQLLRDVASQAGQFIKYGCGKGECGTCECLVDGKWIRPCTTKVPAVPQGQEYVVQVKQVKSGKAASSGKFYSARSFVMGFYNNLIGMVGFVKYRRNAKNNRNERKDYEDLIRQRTLEIKTARAEQQGGPMP